MSALPVTLTLVGLSL